MNTLQITKKIMSKNSVYAKKFYGQNFLIDDDILEKIVSSANLTEEDTVIEIGPGLGNLTHYILQAGANVIAFEIDEDMIDILNDRFNTPKLKIINEDILKVKLDEILKKMPKKVKIIANLPYYITTPIIFKLLEYKDKIESITIMVQKEVAERIVAKPNSKNYGLLTINTNVLACSKKLFDVPNTSFIPAPKVTSAVVQITPDENMEQKYGRVNIVLFNEITKKSFSERRKKLVNSLYNTGLYDLTKEQILGIINKLGLDENCRAEELSIKDYINLTNKVEELKNSSI